MKILGKGDRKSVRNEKFVTRDQFELMPVRSTIEPIFCTRQIVDKFREKERKLCMIYIDREKVLGKFKGF